MNEVLVGGKKLPEEAKIIGVFNCQGGCGMTTVSVGISDIFSVLGYKVLYIDLSDQCNGSRIFGYKSTSGFVDYGRLLAQDCPKSEIMEYIQLARIRTKDRNTNKYEYVPRHNLFIMPGDKDITADSLMDCEGLPPLWDLKDETLSAMEMCLKYKHEKGFLMRFRKNLQKIKDEFDFILIDNNASKNIISQISMAACDSVLSPVSADMFSKRGLDNMIDMLDTIHRVSSHRVRVDGVFINRSNASIESALEVMYQNMLGDNYINIRIPDMIEINEANSVGIPLYTYKPASKVSKALICLMLKLGYITEGDLAVIFSKII